MLPPSSSLQLHVGIPLAFGISHRPALSGAPPPPIPAELSFFLFLPFSQPLPCSLLLCFVLFSLLSSSSLPPSLLWFLALLPPAGHRPFSVALQQARMLKKLITRKPKKMPQSAMSTLEKLHETLEMFEKKEGVLQKKVAREVEKAKDLTKLKIKAAAIQCLKKKKLYEAQIEQLGNFQLRVHDQIIMLENANATTETINALKTGASAVKSIQQSVSIDDIDKTMEQVNGHAENMKQIQEALAAPTYAVADFDEDELEAELEEMEELEEQLLQPPQAIQTPTPSTAHLPKRATPQPAEEVDELATLQAEMAL